MCGRTFDRQLVFLALLLTAVASGGSLSRAADAPPELDPLAPRHWRCIWTEDPATVATLSWSTAAAGRQHIVKMAAVDPAPATDQEHQRTVAAQHNGRFTGDDLELHYHHARLADLQPGTTYEVTLESDGHASPPLRFTTAPADDRPVSVIFGADSRSGLVERRKMNALMARMAAEARAAGRPPIVALAHAGDYVYDGNELSLWAQWMADHELTAGVDGHLLPIIPARGNHDHGEHFNQVFDFPAGDRNYYAVDVGPQLRWITLNTETVVAGKQTKWLAEQLAAARPQYRWVVAQYHRPSYPAAKLPGRGLVHWVPLFEQFNADLVCEGDGHTIKRTPRLRANKIDPTGVPYIGEGGLGVGQRTPNAELWYLRAPHAKAGSDHHLQLLTFDRDKLSYRVVLMSGDTFDEHAWPVRPPEQRAVPAAEEETEAPAAQAAFRAPATAKALK